MSETLRTIPMARFSEAARQRLQDIRKRFGETKSAFAHKPPEVIGDLCDDVAWLLNIIAEQQHFIDIIDEKKTKAEAELAALKECPPAVLALKPPDPAEPAEPDRREVALIHYGKADFATDRLVYVGVNGGPLCDAALAQVRAAKTADQCPRVSDYGELVTCPECLDKIRAIGPAHAAAVGLDRASPGEHDKSVRVLRCPACSRFLKGDSGSPCRTDVARHAGSRTICQARSALRCDCAYAHTHSAHY